MTTSRQVEARILAVLRQAEGGMPVAEPCRALGMSSASLCWWRAKHGGMDASLISRMKAIEDENRRLKRIHAGLGMQADLLKEALGKSCGHLNAAGWPGRWWRHQVSIALACRAFGVGETCHRYSPKLKDGSEETADLPEGLTDAGKTWGFGLCFLQLRNVKGHPWNHKRVYRICAPGLNLRIKPRKRLKRI